jgi:hypothetical protein
MQGADRVNEELEVGFDPPFERNWLWAERIGRVVMVLFVAAGLCGLLGHGPYSHSTVKSAASGLAVDFEPVARSQSATQVTIHLNNDTAGPTLDLFLSNNMVEPMGLQRMLPQPVKVTTVEDGLMLTVAVPPGTPDADLRLMLMPLSLGSNELMARLDGHAPIRWTQFVVP